MKANWATRREFGGDRRYRGKIKSAGPAKTTGTQTARRRPALQGNGAAGFAKSGRIAE